MTEIVYASRKELTASEILTVLEAGGRVVIELSILGKTLNVVIRHQNGTYYCDTPMKLLTHQSRHELRECLEQFQLAKREDTDESEAVNATAQLN